MPPDWVTKNAVNGRSASSTDIPKAAVPHRYQDLLCVILLRSDHQFARPVGDRLHRLDAAHHQIDEHLLRLDPIGEDRGKGGASSSCSITWWATHSRCSRPITSPTTLLTSSGAIWGSFLLAKSHVPIKKTRSNPDRAKSRETAHAGPPDLSFARNRAMCGNWSGSFGGR
jgi:hypothetical protein